MAKPSKPADYGVEQGTVLLGKYRIDAILGHGGMGVVAQCTHLQLEERVAIKFLRDDVTLDEETMRRFLREAQNAVKLKSEHVARVTDVGTFETGVPYMVMEFLEGIDLGQMLEDSGKINPSLAVELLIQACVALAEAHSLGIVHRDIKPGNLFVTWRADGSPLLKILDFGISKAPVGADMNLTQTQSLLGTPAYMSPEQMRSARTVDPRSDIWSLGTVLHEIIQGRRPFEAESFSEMCVKVAVDPPSPLTVSHPPGLDKVILRALEKRPEDRYQNIAEMARDLVPFARDRNGALVAVERMTRMLGRSRPGIIRDESSNPDAVPRGVMRDARSQPVVLPPRPANDTSPTDPTMSGATPPQHPKFDSGALLVGDVTDIIEDTALLGEKTAVTRMDPTDGEVDGDGTRTKVTAIHEDSDDTAERKRKRASDSGHTTIEEEIVFQSGTWTPQTTPAQHVTTDPDLPPAQLPAEAKAEVEHAALASADANAAAAARAAANAAAAAQAHAAAKMLAAQKGRTAPPAAAPTRTGAPRQGASASTAHGSQNPLGATLPGLFPAALPRGPTARTGTPARGNAAIAIGSTPTIAKAEPAVVTARPTGLVPDVRPKRGGLLAGLVLAGLAGIAGGVLYVTQTDEAEEAQTTAPPSPAPAMQGEPAPTPPVQPATGSATAPAPPTPPTADGETKTVEPPAPTPPTAPVAPKPGATQKTSTTGKTGAKPSGGKIGTKPGRGKTTRDDKRDDKRDATPAGGKTTKPPSDDDRAFGVRDPTKPR